MSKKEHNSQYSAIINIWHESGRQRTEKHKKMGAGLSVLRKKVLGYEKAELVDEILRSSDTQGLMYGGEEMWNLTPVLIDAVEKGIVPEYVARGYANTLLGFLDREVKKRDQELNKEAELILGEIRSSISR